MQGDRPGKGLSNQGDGEHHLIDRIDALIREYSPPDVPQSPEDVHQKAQQQIETDYHQAKQKIEEDRDTALQRLSEAGPLGNQARRIIDERANDTISRLETENEQLRQYIQDQYEHTKQLIGGANSKLTFLNMSRTDKIIYDYRCEMEREGNLYNSQAKIATSIYHDLVDDLVQSVEKRVELYRNLSDRQNNQLL